MHKVCVDLQVWLGLEHQIALAASESFVPVLKKRRTQCSPGPHGDQIDLKKKNSKKDSLESTDQIFQNHCKENCIEITQLDNESKSRLFEDDQVFARG